MTGHTHVDLLLSAPEVLNHFLIEDAPVAKIGIHISNVALPADFVDVGGWIDRLWWFWEPKVA
jgi:hypothetical protein